MSNKPTILAFSGSTREGSTNKKVSNLAVLGAEEAGVEVKLIDLRDYSMPLYDGDLEEREGLPEKAKELKKLFIECDGFIIASPEYNSSISGVLKNSIDWVSRKEEDDEAPLVAFTGKAAVIMSASPSGLGGIRGLVTLRYILGNIGVHVLPGQKCLPNAYEAFDEQGVLKSNKDVAGFKKLGRELAEFLIRNKG